MPTTWHAPPPPCFDAMLVVHTHLHRRRTGVTAHVEAVVRALPPGAEARVLGHGVDPLLPRISPLRVWRRSRREPVVVHAHRNLEVLLALLLRLLGAPLSLVVTRHGPNAPSWITRWLLRRADRVVALTDLAARALPVPAVVIPHGVDPARFSPTTDRAAVQASLGLPLAPRVGVVGRIRPAKGQGDFVEAFARISPRHPTWRALLAGLAKDSDTGFLQGLKARLGPRLEHLPPTGNIAQVYGALDVVVQPSHAESFSLVLLEAMASGCCVVAAALPHYPQLLDEGQTGVFYPVGDVDALADRLDRVLADPALRQRLGAAAAAKVARAHTLETQLQALLTLYKEAAAPTENQG